MTFFIINFKDNAKKLIFDKQKQSNYFFLLLISESDELAQLHLHC